MESLWNETQSMARLVVIMPCIIYKEEYTFMILGKRLQNKTLHYCTYYSLKKKKKLLVEEFEFKTYASYWGLPLGNIYISAHGIITFAIFKSS